MPADAVIKTGERTLLGYLVKPFLARSFRFYGKMIMTRCLSRIFRPALPAALGLLLAAGSSLADDGLLSLYRQALTNDADFAAARSTRRRVGKPRHRSCGPVAERVARGRQNAGSFESSGGFRQHRLSSRCAIRSDHRDAARLSQPLFDLARWAAYKEGDARSARAEVVFADARQDLTLRLSQAYFNYLLAADNLELARAQKKALAAQQTQAEICSRRVPPPGPMSRKRAPAINWRRRRVICA